MIKTIAILLLAWGAAHAAAKLPAAQEDSLIVRGLLNEEYNFFDRSIRVFLELYDRTGKVDYLVQAARDGMMEGGDNAAIIARLQRWVAKDAARSRNRQPVRLLVALYARSGALEKAERVSDRWLSQSDDPQDLLLAATLKMDLKKYAEAVKLLERAYGKSMDEKTLLQIATLQVKYLHQPQKAITLLENHLKMKAKSGAEVYFKLIGLYAGEKRLDKVLELYKKLYEIHPRKALLEKIIKLSLYTRDFDGLIRFLEARPGNEELLYMLYKEQNRYDKAIALAKERYAQTHKPKWLAEEAILIYEEAKAKKKITPQLLKRFRELFDRALEEGADESLYLNYYGYTLIDHDLDLDRGIALVRKALEQQPKNSYYLDSLAWGLYKKGRCAEARKIMEKVMATGEIKEPEIEMHWKKIKECEGMK